MKPATPESIIKRDIRLALGRERDLVIWCNSAGITEIDGRKVRYGLVAGASDLLGILAPRGRWFCLEVKAGKNKPTPDQEMFMALIRRKGGFAAAVWTVDEAKAALARAREGKNE